LLCLALLFAGAHVHAQQFNFAALGYGDIVMSERWRLLGALEATNGVLMLGLSSGGVLSVMNGVLSQHKGLQKARERLSS